MDRHVDHTAYYFQRPTPAKIRGEPTYKTLKKLQSILRGITSSVDSGLGGGNYGYLFLILDNIGYQRILGRVTFTVPVYPPALNISAAATAVEAVHL